MSVISFISAGQYFSDRIMKCLKEQYIIWWMLGFVVVMYLLNLSMIFFVDSSTDRGTFGDQFGAVNALFSGLAFAGLIYTIILQRRDLALQRKDLALQRKELELTRGELKNQTGQQEEQNKILRIQRFENTFFQMLTQFQEIVNGLTFSYTMGGNTMERQGREIFYETFEKVFHYSDIETNGAEIYRYKGMRELLKETGFKGYVESDTPTCFDHYFRFLYRILKFIKESPLVDSYDEEYEYAAILRSLLSRYELVWLYYNGLSTYGVDKLKPLIERYAMLKSLRDDLLVETDINFGVYSDGAYKRIDPQ